MKFGIYEHEDYWKGKSEEIPVVSEGTGWYKWHKEGEWRFVGPESFNVKSITRIEFTLRTGTSPEKLSRGLLEFSKLHEEICKRRHKLFQQLARGEIEKITQEDIRGESNGKKPK